MAHRYLAADGHLRRGQSQVPGAVAHIVTVAPWLAEAPIPGWVPACTRGHVLRNTAQPTLTPTLRVCAACTRAVAPPQPAQRGARMRDYQGYKRAILAALADGPADFATLYAACPDRPHRSTAYGRLAYMEKDGLIVRFWPPGQPTHWRRAP